MAAASIEPGDMFRLPSGSLVEVKDCETTNVQCIYVQTCEGLISRLQMREGVTFTQAFLQRYGVKK